MRNILDRPAQSFKMEGMPRASFSFPTTLAHRQGTAVRALYMPFNHVVVIINDDPPAGPV